jgi:transcriptional regulator with XRE-family HTH domain
MATPALNRDEAVDRYARELTAWRERRRLTKKALADAMSYDPSYVSHIEAGRQLPTEEFTRQAEAVLGAGGALWDHWQQIEAARYSEPRRRPPTRELRLTDFISWLADHSSMGFPAVYAAVEQAAAQLDAEPRSEQLARQHGRRHVRRDQVAAAIADYYETSGLYTVDVQGDDVCLSIYALPDWLAAVPLGGPHEYFEFVPPRSEFGPQLDDVTLSSAVRRLAAAELSDTVMVNNPLYRLLDFDVGPHELRATVTTVDFAAYALTTDMLGDELVDAIAAGGGPQRLRAIHLPDVETAVDLARRTCVGGLNALVAAARNPRPSRPADYVLLVQERSSTVLNLPGALAVIPKAFHQPTGEAAEEAPLSVTLLRELEEELLGRVDLEQLTEEAYRHVDPLHAMQTSEPLLWLLDRRNTFRTECTGFGFNLVTGSYDLLCLVVIDDPAWWDTFGHLVAANWESMRIRRYSSHDTAGLADLVHDPRWSNEGLFGLLQGLLRLGEIGDPARLALPPITVEM